MSASNSAAQGGSGRAGNTGPVDASGIFALQQKLQNGTLGAGDLATAQAAFDAASNNLGALNRNAGAFSFDGARSVQEQFNIARRALEITKGMQRREGTGSAPGALRQQDFAQGQPSGAGVNGASFSVTINLGSTQKTINTASQADAQALVAMMQSLGDAANRTGP